MDPNNPSPQSFTTPVPPPPKKFNKFILTLLLVVVALVVGAAVLMYSKNKLPDYRECDPGPCVNSQQTSDWKTYTNTNDGYSVKYPPNFRVWLENDLVNYDPENPSYERGNPDGVKIQIQKRDMIAASFEKEIDTLNKTIAQLNGAGGSETKIESKILGNFTYYNRVTASPGGVFDVYYAPGKTPKTYFAVLIWGAQNDPGVVASILSSFRFDVVNPIIGRECGGGAMGNGGACPIGYTCKITSYGPPNEGICQKGEAAKKETYIFTRTTCWGTPPPDYMERQQAEQAEIDKLKLKYEVIVKDCDRSIQ